ncbi:hypothetical protein [Enterococcus sp.]|uniref:hypothetical protein n=1 Tax=Enterococcus sp. TaxID=35783 RepID=UPI0028AA4E0B|nr:hypothetical protein [Enterococcus sp.]
MIEIEDFESCKIDGNTVGDLARLLSKLDQSKVIYFIVPMDGGNMVKDGFDLEPAKSEKLDGTENGYTIIV